MSGHLSDVARHRRSLIPSSERRGAQHHIITLTCCRPWPIAAGQPVKSCGICGEVPTERREQR